MTKKRSKDKRRGGEDPWARAKRLCRLSARHIEMAKALGMNPKKLPGLIPSKTQQWKAPVSVFLEDLYAERFGIDAPLLVGPAASRHAGRRNVPVPSDRAPKQEIPVGNHRASDVLIDLVCHLQNLVDDLERMTAAGVEHDPRRLFKLYWRRKSRSKPHWLPPGTKDLIRRLALENRLWGAERIRGELLKLGIKVSKRTIQRILVKLRDGGRPHSGQSWHDFVHNHATQIWSCDFVQAHDLLFRSIFAFFIMDIHTRRIVHYGVTRHPTDAWVKQQLREATAWDVKPDHLILDNDGKFGGELKGLAESSDIDLVFTANEAPLMNSFIERFNGSVRRECLDHLLILSEAGMRRLVGEYVRYHNELRPHQGLRQHRPNYQHPPDV